MKVKYSFMLTEEHIKEAISQKFIELIASNNGYGTDKPAQDYGTDLSISEKDFRLVNEKKILYDTGRELKIQLKSTTEKSITIEEGLIKYDLDVKAYNDLITRKTAKTPLILLLFILPNDRDKWVNITENELIARKCAYWYLPDEQDELTENIFSKRISISVNNIFNNEALVYLFENYS